MNESSPKSHGSHGRTTSTVPRPSDGAVLGAAPNASGLAETHDPARGSQPQPDVEPSRPASGQQAQPVVCSRCSTPNEPGAPVCVSCKSFLPANQLQRTHGAFAKHQPADVIDAADELHAGLLSDKGGEREMSTLQRSIAAKLRDIEILLSLNKHTIVTEGVETAAGRRAHDRYLAALDRFKQLATLLGVEREAKQIDLARAFAEQGRKR